jgi:transposase
MSETKPPRVRTREPFRRQGVIRFEMPEDALPESHRARLLWRIVQTLDLSAFTAGAKAVEGRQGRALLSVHMLLTLWLYAISEGIGSAREIERRIDCDDAFRWIVGDESVGHSKLSEFRVGHREALDKLLTDVLASLMHKGLLSLDLVAQDGTRVRAHASAPSFRRELSLLEYREQAALHVKAVFAEAEDPNVSEREKRAREAAALDYRKSSPSPVGSAPQGRIYRAREGGLAQWARGCGGTAEAQQGAGAQHRRGHGVGVVAGSAVVGRWGVSGVGPARAASTRAAASAASTIPSTWSS